MPPIYFCHIVPRDKLLQLTALFLLISTGFLIAVFMFFSSKGSIGTLSDNYYLQTGVILHANNTKLCQEGCDNYSYYSTIVSVLVLIGSILTILALVFLCFCVTPCLKTSRQMFVSAFTSVLFPFVFLLSGVIIIDRVLVTLARRELSLRDAPLAIGSAYGCLIAALVCVIAAVFFASTRLFLYLTIIPRIKADYRESRNIGGLMNLRVVNDDWRRQNQMWDLHVQAVFNELERAVEVSHSNKNSAIEC